MRSNVRPVVVAIATGVAALPTHQVTLVDGFVAREALLSSEALKEIE